MIKEAVKDLEKNEFEKKEQKKILEKLQEELAVIQQKAVKASLPTIVVFEGFSASGKGEMISNVIAELDPRSYKVHSIPTPTSEELRYPFLSPFWNKIPLKGNFAIFDRSWYNRLMSGVENQDIDENAIDSINIFERQLVDDGYLIIKFFLHIGKKEQKKRLEKLASSHNTSWRVTSRDIQMNKNYDKRIYLQDNLIEKTNPEYAKWNIILNENELNGAIEVLQIIKNTVSSALESKQISKTKIKSKFKTIKMPKLCDVDLSLSISGDEYKDILKAKKEKLKKLHSAIYREKIPVILAFEGWDAAGKGGAIRRLSWALDPRGFEVIPVSAPNHDELHRHYLWRFWKNLQKDGHITIFDRSWYGRVMVERLEKITPEKRCLQGFNEINEFENELTKWGAIVIKFWIQIDKDIQLERFEDRQNTPEKQYKITDEDWRNRAKWDSYEIAIDEMIKKTSTKNAPWVIVEGNNKKYARIKIISTVIDAFEKRLSEI